MERDCGAWVNILSHKVKKRLNATLADLGVTGVQSRVMDVEEAFELSRSTTTNILQLMEKNGIIRRESVACDARLKSLVPTEKAGSIDNKVRDCVIEIEEVLTRGISQEQVQQFLATAKRMSANLDE